MRAWCLRCRSQRELPGADLDAFVCPICGGPLHADDSEQVAAMLRFVGPETQGVAPGVAARPRARRV